jgi:hypothetical protein
MPKNVFTPRLLPREQPDRCELCPLVGVIPKDQQRKGKRERYYCLGIYEAETDEFDEPVLDEHGQQQMSFPRLSSKGISVSASAWKKKGHLWHRPCDYVWASWMTLPGRVFGMPTDVYNAYRIPYEKEQMIKHMPRFNFRIRNRK